MRAMSTSLWLIEITILALLIARRCSTASIPVDNQEQIVAHELEILQLYIQDLTLTPEEGGHSDDVTWVSGFKYLAEQYFDDNWATSQGFTREKVAETWRIPLENLDGVAERFGLHRKHTCDHPKCGINPEPALPLDDLGVPWRDFTISISMIGWRKMRLAGLDTDLPDDEDELNNLPVALGKIPKFMARQFAAKEWEAILDDIRYKPEKMTDEDRIFLLAGLGRRDIQLLGKAIVYPQILAPEERWAVQGYPPPEEASRNIQHVLKFERSSKAGDSSIKRFLDRVAYQPSTISRLDGELLSARFAVPLGYRDYGLKHIHEWGSLSLYKSLLATNEYIDVERIINYAICGLRCRTQLLARRATQTKEEFLAKYNCWYRYMFHVRELEVYDWEKASTELDRLLEGETREFRVLYRNFFFEHLDEFRATGFDHLHSIPRMPMAWNGFGPDPFEQIYV